MEEMKLKRKKGAHVLHHQPRASNSPVSSTGPDGAAPAPCKHPGRVPKHVSRSSRGELRGVVGHIAPLSCPHHQRSVPKKRKLPRPSEPPRPSKPSLLGRQKLPFKTLTVFQYDPFVPRGKKGTRIAVLGVTITITEL